MKRSQAPAQPKPEPPARAAEATIPEAAATPVAPEFTSRPRPHQVTTEEAMDAWRNEGDPN